MTEQAKEARRAYGRAWYAKNREKVKERAARYWERKAREREEREKEGQRGGA